VEQSSNGNLDDPQFQWLESELQAAEALDKLVVVFGHHPIRSLNSNAPDEAAGPCTGVEHGHGEYPEHDHSPGCDIDPRPSTPIHYGEPGQRPSGNTDETLSELLDRFPHVLAYVAGHTHENRVEPFTSPGHVWWGIETAATADWPVQHRLVELMDNRDGTLSIFGTVLDGASSSQAPAPGSAMAFDEAMLASLGREFAYNDPQAGLGSGEGSASDQNVELLVKDPRRADLTITKSDSPDPVEAGEPLTYTLQITNDGPSGASGVTVTDMLPPSVSYVSATPSQGTCMEAAGTVTCDLGLVAVGANPTVTITVIPNVPGTIVNTASVEGNQEDPDTADNSDTENTNVLNVGYVRPAGAGPLRISLVPAHNQCTSPNREHGPPLDDPSCRPPLQSSNWLTTGGEANGQPAKSVGSLRLGVVMGNPSTTADEADVTIRMSITDVRRKSDLTDYSGQVQGTSTLRITDRYNQTPGPPPNPPIQPATVVDIPFPIPGTCASTANPTIGSTCSANTTFDAIVSGAVKEGQRSVWQFGQFLVSDGGSDGLNNTLPNTLFAIQGIFVP
jgi:uncharacterized repeat protein (TIGR01451 family)